VRLPGQSNFAGSALRPIDGIRRAALMLGKPWSTVWPSFCQVPAHLMNLATGLEPGATADFCLIQVDAQGRPDPMTTWTRGQIVTPQ
jgi:N-acetylglucosamine-6-phosphate deacetylase